MFERFLFYEMFSSLVQFPTVFSIGKNGNDSEGTHQLAFQDQVLHRISKSDRNPQAEKAYNDFPLLFEVHWRHQLHRIYSSSHQRFFHTGNWHTECCFSKSHFNNFPFIIILLIFIHPTLWDTCVFFKT